MNNLTYQKNGDYQIPNLTVGLENYPETVGKYGMLRETHLKTHRSGTYSRMLQDGSLWPHLCQVDEQAQAQVDLMMDELMKAQGVTESLKESNQMLWVQMVTNIKAQAEEVVLREMIYC